MKKKLLTVICVFGVLTLIVGMTALAATTYGGSSDPLVTLSYVNDVLKPELVSRFDEQLEGRIDQLDDALEKKVSELEARYAESAGVSERSTYHVVTLETGQKLTGSVGTELMLRVGSANVTSPASPGLIDTTSGGVLENGKSMTKNHMYMVTIDGRAITATTRAMVLVRGEYKIS